MRVTIPIADGNTEIRPPTRAKEATMQLLAPIAPRVILGRAIDIVDGGPDQGMSRGFARVDLGDPVFFDHPLDHVPGMLLVVAVLELAEHASMLEPDSVTFRLTFTRFCELGAPVKVTATGESCGTSRIELIQSGRSVANGLLARRGTQPLMERPAVPALGDGSISGELVHRVDPRNIAVGPLTIEDGRVWTRVREQGAISGLPPRAGAVASILDAARQFGIAILHRWGEHPLGAKMIFVGLTAEVPTAVPLGHVARALSWQVTPPEQTGKLCIEVHEVGDRASKVGSILMVGRCVDGDEYAQLRAG
jgi:2-oxo-3-(phosphooxy)propyl 3-oxoalkanoate synthase